MDGSVADVADDYAAAGLASFRRQL